MYESPAKQISIAIETSSITTDPSSLAYSSIGPNARRGCANTVNEFCLSVAAAPSDPVLCCAMPEPGTNAPDTVCIFSNARIRDAAPGQNCRLAFRAFPVFTARTTVALGTCTTLGSETEANATTDGLEGKIAIQALEVGTCTCF